MSNCLLTMLCRSEYRLRACAIVDTGVQLRFQTTIHTNALTRLITAP